MNKFSLSEISNFMSCEYHGEDAVCRNISIDSRQVNADDLFVAIEGDHFDGHDYLSEVEAKGASALVVNKINPNLSQLPHVAVEDTRVALGQLASWHKKRTTAKTIAITGSCGKTTVKEMLASILSAEVGAEKVLATKGNFNNDIGVPLTLFGLNKEHQYAVLELGANHLNEISNLSSIVMPDIALITNVHPAHIEGFGSLQNIAEAKSEIFDSLSATGTAVVNGDDPFYDFWKKKLSDKHLVSYGFKPGNDFFVKEKKNGSAVDMHTFVFPSGEMAVKLKLLGDHNTMNALAASTIAYLLGVESQYIKQGLEMLEPIAGRLRSHELLNGSVVIDDTYNANPGSTKAAIDVLSSFPGDFKFILVLGELAELGTESEALHLEVGAYAKQQGIDHLMALGSYGHKVVEGFSGNNHSDFFTNKASLVEGLARQLKKNKVVVLVKGSRSAQMETVVDDLLTMQFK